MKAANLATHCSTRTAQRSTIPICLWPALLATAKPKPAPCDKLAFEQIPESRHGRRSAADPAFERLQDRESDGAGAHPQDELESLLRGYGYDPISRRATIPTSCTSRWRSARRQLSAKFAPFRKMRARKKVTPSAPAGRCSLCALPKAGPARK